jgi:hypothetical protein
MEDNVAKSDSNKETVERLRRERAEAERSGNADRLRQIDQQIAEAEGQQTQ